MTVGISGFPHNSVLNNGLIKFIPMLGGVDIQHMKFCEVKMTKGQRKSTNAKRFKELRMGMYAPGELIFCHHFRHFHLNHRIGFSSSRRIHAVNVNTP